MARKNRPLRLGVNIDHVATLRNARGGIHPCPLQAAHLAQQAGADGITAHLREDRRHIRDADIARLKSEISLPLNLEMAATSEMLAIALQTKPHAACIVPEKRSELTTEGGLDVVGQEAHLTSFCANLREAGIRISLFVNADIKQIDAAKRCKADIVEIHTGHYCETRDPAVLHAIKAASAHADAVGLEVHAGHGLNYETVGTMPRFLR